MVFKDNRDYIEALKKTGDVVCIKKEVDWDLEAGAISRRAMERFGPATFFEKIKDYPDGRIFAGAAATYRRVAIAMGLPSDTPIKEIYDEYERRDKKQVPPVIVKDAPCKENMMTGDKIDLFAFPAPMCHAGDGGRYLGTWGFTVSKDLDTDWVNWGMYRFMILNQRLMSGNPTPPSNFATMFRGKYLPQKKAAPVALVIGADPISSITATAGYRVGESEVNFAGGLRQEPVELIKCETSDLYVPAHAEIIIEGEIAADRVAPEGPFGEYTGYRTGGSAAHLLLRVKAVTYRSKPIVTMCVHGIPADEGHIGGAIGVAIAIKRRLQQEGLPVVDVFLPPEGASHLAVISVSRGGNAIAKAVKEAITKRRAWYNKIIVVDDDVDVYNLSEVVHALSVKCHSYRGIFTYDEPGKGNPVTPCYSKEEAAKAHGAVGLFDATWPLEWAEEDIPVKSSFKTIYPPEIQEKVIKNWKEYGF